MTSATGQKLEHLDEQDVSFLVKNTPKEFIDDMRLFIIETNQDKLKELVAQLEKNARVEVLVNNRAAYSKFGYSNQYIENSTSLEQNVYWQAAKMLENFINKD